MVELYIRNNIGVSTQDMNVSAKKRHVNHEKRVLGTPSALFFL